MSAAPEPWLTLLADADSLQRQTHLAVMAGCLGNRAVRLGNAGADGVEGNVFKVGFEAGELHLLKRVDAVVALEPGHFLGG